MRGDRQDLETARGLLVADRRPLAGPRRSRVKRPVEVSQPVSVTLLRLVVSLLKRRQTAQLRPANVINERGDKVGKRTCKPPLSTVSLSPSEDRLQRVRKDQLRAAQWQWPRHLLRPNAERAPHRNRRPPALTATTLPVARRRHPSLLNAVETGGLAEQIASKTDRRACTKGTLRDDGLLVARITRRLIPRLLQAIGAAGT